MREYVTLRGAEDVKAAGYAMQEAARSIRSGVAEMDDVLRRFLNDWRELLESYDQGDPSPHDGHGETCPGDGAA